VYLQLESINLRETASRSEGEQQLSVRLNCNLISTINQKLHQRQLVELKVVCQSEL